MDSSLHVDNQKKDILVISEGTTQGFNDTTHPSEKKCTVNFTVSKKKFCFSLHYNGDNSYLFVNATDTIKLKDKDSKIVGYPVCLRNISKDFSISNMKKTGLYASVFYFSVDYKDTAIDDILYIHKYLMKKNNIK